MLIPRCTHWVRFQGAGAVAVVGICEGKLSMYLHSACSHCRTVIMILRVYALYRGNKFILVGLFAIFLTQVGFQSYALSGGIRTSPSSSY